ncbi:MAG: aminomethyl transferase family protein, partial [Planctomycetes bacterium]|nr:aminomethyl transferase family protein [Planctomycetota bacterium]
RTTVHRGVTMAARFAPLEREYLAANKQAALFDRSHRGLIVARGGDRKTWLNNLITNVVATLGDNEGSYAFATDVKGRTQFDLNVLSAPSELLLDVDRLITPDAQAHLERFLITEDVELEIVSDAFARIGCSGPQANRVAKSLGVENFTPMPSLSSVAIAGGDVRLFRHDFAGQPGFELIVPAREAVIWWDRLIADCGVTPCGIDTAEVLRIEAALPAWGADIDGAVIPPETGQIERGISYHKGCYLGQEVIERMRSHGSLGRRLTRFVMDDGQGLTPPLPITRDAKQAGRITSLAQHPSGERWIALGYLRTSITDPDGLTVGDPPRPIRVAG